MSNTFTSEPTVKVKELTRLLPIVETAITRIKNTIAEDGYFSIKEFIALSGEIKIDEEVLLNELYSEGIVYIKTGAVNRELHQEVLVDIRYMAAAMLLIYSDKTFALKHSVFKYLTTLFKIAQWKAAFPMIILPGLLKDMYEQYGHNFTVMEMADNADLTHEQEEIILSRAQRYTSAMQELAKNDTELTEVYHLAERVMMVANGGTINGRKAERADVQYRRLEKPKAYNLFWTEASKILDRFAKKKKK